MKVFLFIRIKEVYYEKNNNRKKNGLTLIELIVSMAIISVITVSMLNIFGTGLLNISRAGNRTVNTETASNHFITNPDPVTDEIISGLILKIM